MSGNLTNNNRNDDQMNKDTYESVMQFCARFGVPAAAALTVFFTSLVMANGVFVSICAGIFVFAFAAWVSTTFFSH